MGEKSLKSIAHHKPPKKGVCGLLLVNFVSSFAIAQEQLDIIDVTATSASGSEATGKVSGFGVIEKNNYSLQEAQVENIRDLTRYDPGISVNEAGGRGGSRGFSMRGVEKERVAVSIDGFNTAPVLRRQDRASLHRPSASSASINEIEYENLKAVDIYTGSASSISGSGALGGSVSMRTKETLDFFEVNPDAELAGRIKMGYTSKDGRKMLSLGIAAKHSGIEGFIQYTGRGGHEIRAHELLYKQGKFIENYSDKYYLNLPEGGRYFSAYEVSGPDRSVPNPLDYTSRSLLSKIGMQISEHHYLGVNFENTIQSYDIKDLNFPNYHTSRIDRSQGERIFDMTPTINMIKYTPTRYYHDIHKHQRFGLEYRYQSNSHELLIDNAKIRFDRRYLTLNSGYADLNCAPWPEKDPNCWPSEDTSVKANNGKLGRKANAILSEDDWKLDIHLDKAFSLGNTTQNAKLQTGIIHSTYSVDDNSIKIYNLYGERKPKDESASSTGEIRNKNFFIGLSDNFLLNENMKLGGSIRYDLSVFNANPTDIQRARGMNLTHSEYHNFSWGGNIAWTPFNNFELGYRVSSGFRIPSVIEQIGLTFNNERFIKAEEQIPLESESSLNHEVGIKYQTEWLSTKASYFINYFNNLIDTAAISKGVGNGTGAYVYHNLHHFKTHGFNMEGRIHLHDIWSGIPDGMSLFGKVGNTKILQRSKLDPKYSLASTYTFDAIQPLKAIYGVEYHHPEGIWGISLKNTYSAAKDSDELVTISQQGGLQTTGTRFAMLSSRPWHITDITAYYNINDHFSVHAGIYNLWDTAYLTWESARQGSFGSEARISTNNYKSLISPGRNYLINFEAKF